MSKSNKLILGAHNANVPIPDHITHLWYLLQEPLPPLPPNLKCLKLDSYNHPLTLNLPQSLATLIISNSYAHSIPSLPNLNYLLIPKFFQFNKVSLPSLKTLIISSELIHPIDAYLPNLENIKIHVYTNPFPNYLLYNKYIYYLTCYNLIWYNGSLLDDMYFNNIVRRTETNRYNKTKRQASLFDDLL